MSSKAQKTSIDLPGWLSKRQSNELRQMIKDHVDAQVADSWRGGAGREDWPLIEATASYAAARLEHFISKLEPSR